MYQRIPGTYNAKLVSKENCSDNEIDKFDYSKTVNSITAWIAKNEEWF